MRRVVQDTGYIRPVRVALLKGDGHLGARQQGQMQAVRVTGIRARLAYPQTLFSRLPVVAVEQQVDPVTPVAVDMAVDITAFRAGDPRGSVPAITGLAILAGRKP